MQEKEVSKIVSDFYNVVSYSAYGEDYFPVVKSLGFSKEEFAIFAKNKNALEVGCGGGQLSVFLASYFNSVTAIDISDSSLNMAKQECLIRGIKNISFLQADLYDESFLQNNIMKYDFVLCYGVLHHTGNPKLGYTNLTKLLKVGGSLIVGVYSRTEIFYRIKRKIVLLLAGKAPEKRAYWAQKLWFGNKGNKVTVHDGYVHPQVSFHSINEVYNWIVNNKLKYSGSWPFIELSWYLKKIFGLKIKRQDFSSLNYFAIVFLFVELLWMLSGKSVMVTMAAIKEK